MRAPPARVSEGLNLADGYTLVPQPAPAAGSLRWVWCFSGGQTTKDGVTTSAMPTLPSEYAPPACR